MKKLLLILCLGVFTSTLYAQNTEQRRSILKNYDKEKQAQAKKEVDNYLKSQNKKVDSLIAVGVPQFIFKNESRGELMRVDNTGNPIYFFTNNDDASKSTRTNFLQVGGSLGLELTGEGLDIGVWDGGHVMQSHIEFIGSDSNSRVETFDSADEEFHATHVAGTIGANGINTDARGMATESNIKSYNWTQDVQEVQAEAFAGLLISNHSYGTPVQNAGSSANIGKYTSESRIWDVLTNMAPNYLPVISAGNDGNETNNNPLATGFDKLVGNKVSKNVMVVANAEDANLFPDGSGTIAFEVNINSGSSQGPADDGRIKPDITGNGTGVLSTSNQNNSAYAESTGTSMAAPNIAGSLLLLQEYFYELNNEFMSSAMLKGLVCLTADDFGLEGPDPKFGWGLMNSKLAAEIMLEANSGPTALILEENLNQGETYTITINVESGADVKVGIAWNDPAASANNSGTNDSTPALVNDIDLRVNDNSSTFYPWMLDLQNIASAAITGDNIVDNIEVIEIDDAGSGTYTIEVSHKGSLSGGTQNFSLIVTGIESSSVSTDDFKQNEISFWPNPVKSNLNISGKDYGFSEDVNAEVYDMTGRLVKSFNNFDNANNLSLDLNSLSQGIYIVKLNDGRKSIKKRIIKE